jgi:hypothetical protein
MTSIADRNKSEFIPLAILYIGVFAASTVVQGVGSVQQRDESCKQSFRLPADFGGRKVSDRMDKAPTTR